MSSGRVSKVLRNMARSQTKGLPQQEYTRDGEIDHRGKRAPTRLTQCTKKGEKNIKKQYRKVKSPSKNSKVRTKGYFSARKG